MPRVIEMCCRRMSNAIRPLNVSALTGGEYVTGLTESGFLASYGKYKFRIAGYQYHQDSINGITLDVMRPDNTIVSVQASETMQGIIVSDSLEILLPRRPIDNICPHRSREPSKPGSRPYSRDN